MNIPEPNSPEDRRNKQRAKRKTRAVAVWLAIVVTAWIVPALLSVGQTLTITIGLAGTWAVFLHARRMDDEFYSDPSDQGRGLEIVFVCLLGTLTVLFVGLAVIAPLGGFFATIGVGVAALGGVFMLPVVIALVITLGS